MATDLKRITRGELICWQLRHRGQTLVIAEQGAQVLEYRRDGEPPILWLSEQAAYRIGHGVRGGVPVCWPWFGALSAEIPDSRVLGEMGPDRFIRHLEQRVMPGL